MKKSTSYVWGSSALLFCAMALVGAGCAASNNDETAVDTNSARLAANATVTSDTPADDESMEASEDTESGDESMTASDEETVSGEEKGGADVSSESESEEVDTSDWQTYANEEYGFSFQYPAGMEIDDQYGEISLIIEKVSALPETVNEPTSRVSSQTRSENEALSESFSNGTFKEYIDYIQGGTLRVENVTYIDNAKISLIFDEGDNSQFAEQLNKFGREELIVQYKNNSIENEELKERYQEYLHAINSFSGNL